MPGGEKHQGLLEALRSAIQEKAIREGMVTSIKFKSSTLTGRGDRTRAPDLLIQNVPEHKIGIIEVGDSETRAQLRSDAEHYLGGESESDDQVRNDDISWVMTVKILNARLVECMLYTREGEEGVFLPNRAVTSYINVTTEGSTFTVSGTPFSLPLAPGFSLDMSSQQDMELLTFFVRHQFFTEDVSLSNK
ncbi:hypothetical protein KEM55_003715 [Ascosphaera atra]|nr:hypothetical protein KEM55_003715 [Ascosphaera atra]